MMNFGLITRNGGMADNLAAYNRDPSDQDGSFAIDRIQANA